MAVDLLVIAACITVVKVLLIPSYHSTDFEVHRNWLAITHSLPLSKWYYEETSDWTLDYPPLFAWFEYILSQVAALVDSDMVKVANLNYASTATVVFQRLSVICTDLLFIFAVKEFCDKFVTGNKKEEESEITSSPRCILAVLLMCNFGLLLVDHIHFQYNGFLFGMLLFSILRMYEGRVLESSLWFAGLLNFKHIFLYIAPAYGIFLLKAYCFQSDKKGKIEWRSFSPFRLISLAVMVLATFFISFGPFILLGQVPQVLSRLFPFKRGLCHAYWAPNFWTIYNIVDKGAAHIGVRLGFLSPTSLQAAAMTGGLVQEFHHAVLPSVTPGATFILTLLSMLPALLHIWRAPSDPRSFLRCVVLCGFGSFMFGWHVHEKAILMVIIPLSLLVFDKRQDAQVFLFLSTIGHYSLLPLIFTIAEYPVKMCMLLAYTVYAFISLGSHFPPSYPQYVFNLPLLTRLESLYLLGLLPLELYATFLHGPLLGLQRHLPFLPLLLTSVYCSLGVTYAWIKFYWNTVKKSKKPLPKVQ